MGIDEGNASNYHLHEDVVKQVDVQIDDAAMIHDDHIGRHVTPLEPLQTEFSGYPMAHVVVGEEHSAPRGKITQPQPEPLRKPSTSIVDGYIFLIVFGWVGAHQAYVGRYKWFLLYILTLGCLGWGIVIDLFRLPALIKAYDRKTALGQSNNMFVEPNEYSVRLLDCYTLWIFGFLGAPHFYLGDYKRGLLYFFTFGLLGVGWVVDLFRMPMIVRERTPKPNSNV